MRADLAFPKQGRLEEVLAHFQSCEGFEPVPSGQVPIAWLQAWVSCDGSGKLTKKNKETWFTLTRVSAEAPFKVTLKGPQSEASAPASSSQPAGTAGGSSSFLPGPPTMGNSNTITGGSPEPEEEGHTVTGGYGPDPIEGGNAVIAAGHPKPNDDDTAVAASPPNKRYKISKKMCVCQYELYLTV